MVRQYGKTGRVVDPACYIAMDLKGAAHKQ